MKQRILVALPLIALLAVVLVFDGVVRVIAFSLFAIVSVYEMQNAFQTKGYHVFAGPAYLFAAGYNALTKYCGTLWLMLLGFVCLLLIAGERIFNKKRTTEESLMSLLIFVYPLMFFVALMLISEYVDPVLSLSPLLMTFAGPLVGDTLAYFIGKFFGKRKLCPEISPKKTVAGSVAGLFGGVLGGVLVYFIQTWWGGSVAWFHLMIIGLLCGGIGQIGDLFASSIKRWAGVKDFGTIFPGHGGVLDRVDSVLMCAPVVLIYCCIVFNNIIAL